jgi:hypothetical protein
VRPTLAKTFLVGGKVAGTMYECDSTGAVKWQAQAGGEPYMALRLPNGNTVISTGYGAQMVLVDSKAAVLKRFPTQSDINGSAFWSQAQPYFFAGFQILKNGNIVVSNWEGHGGGNGGKGFQLIEIDSGLSRVVSYWKQDAALVSSLHGVLVLDSLDTKLLHSDINGILAPVAPPVAVAPAQLSRPVLGSRSAIRKIRSSRLFDLSGRMVPRNMARSTATAYIGKAGTAHSTIEAP